MLDEILKKVVEKWKSEDLELVLPYSEKEVRDSFNKIGKSVSKDVVQVYTTIGGMTWIDSNLLEFWKFWKNTRNWTRWYYYCFKR